MARTSSNPRVVNRSARAKLKTQREPHWHLIAEGQHLGYRKLGESRGTWIARCYVKADGDESGKPGRRYFKSLGSADDTVDADATAANVLSFQQAQEKARQWFLSRAGGVSEEAPQAPYTVSDAGRAWMACHRGSDDSKSNAESNLKYHILPNLGKVELCRLTSEQIESWLNGLADKPPVRMQERQAKPVGTPSRQSKVKYDPDDPETKRKRRDTANRIFNDLRALLSKAYKSGKITHKAWERVSKFENVALAKNEHLSLEEAQRCLEACPADFRDLVRGALVTGCRYAELAALPVSAYHAPSATIAVIQRKRVKRKQIFLTDEEVNFFNKKVLGKQPDDLMFRKADGTPWKKSNQQPRIAAALRAAGIERRVRFHDLRHTFASLLAMSGTSLLLIGDQLGHSGTRMAERHYAHLSPSYKATTIRANKPSFG